MHVVKPYNPKNKYTFYRYFNCISKHVANKNCYQQYKLLCLNKQLQDHWNIGIFSNQISIILHSEENKRIP